MTIGPILLVCMKYLPLPKWRMTKKLRTTAINETLDRLDNTVNGDEVSRSQPTIKLMSDLKQLYCFELLPAQLWPTKPHCLGLDSGSGPKIMRCFQIFF